MNSGNTDSKKRKMKWGTPYSKMTVQQAEARLNFQIRQFLRAALPVESMLANGNNSENSVAILKVDEIKEEVYKQLVRYLLVEGYPTDADPSFKEANINDLVYAAISPILEAVIRNTGRTNLQLLREKEIVSTDGEAGGMEEFVVIDEIYHAEGSYVVIVEAKRSSVGVAMKQCLLSLRDARDNNERGEVYGFVTTGETWRMLTYDGNKFCVSRKFDLVFEGMAEEREKWMKEYSVMVDCMFFALRNGGVVMKDVVVR